MASSGGRSGVDADGAAVNSAAESPPLEAAFRVIAPNAARRQRLQNQAQAELAAYEKYKQSRQPPPMVAETPRRLCNVDEPVPSIDEARARQQHQQSTARIRKTNQLREAQAKARMEEEEIYRLKKEAARKKSEENERRRIQREANRVHDVRQKRCEYFHPGPEVPDGLTALRSEIPADHSLSADSAEVSLARAVQRGRDIRAKAKEEEEEKLRKKKEEARKQAERNEERREEREKVDVQDLRARRLAALGV